MQTTNSPSMNETVYLLPPLGKKFCAIWRMTFDWDLRAVIAESEHRFGVFTFKSKAAAAALLFISCLQAYFVVLFFPLVFCWAYMLPLDYYLVSKPIGLTLEIFLEPFYQVIQLYCWEGMLKIGKKYYFWWRSEEKQAAAELGQAQQNWNWAWLFGWLLDRQLS